MLQPPRVPNITPFHSTTSHFRVTGHFETSALNDPKMTLNTKRLKVPHIHVTTTPQPQCSLCFTIRPPFLFWVTCHLRRVHQMTPKWFDHWHIKDTRYTRYNYPRVPGFIPFHSTASRFRVTGHFETSAQNDPKWPQPFSWYLPFFISTLATVLNFNLVLNILNLNFRNSYKQFLWEHVEKDWLKTNHRNFYSYRVPY